MKLGFSTYSLVRKIKSGKMNVLEVMDWTAVNGGKHVEVVPIGFDLAVNDELVDAIRQKTAKTGISISNYAIHADFIKENNKEYEEEIKRVMGEVDIANRLGAKLMRHDVGPFTVATNKNNMAGFVNDLPKLVHACREIADYANKYGITTTVENHGFYINGSERIFLLVQEVNRPNFKITLDVGNFLCVDEDPIEGVKKLLPYTAMIHLKDFYCRSTKYFPKELVDYKCKSGFWFSTLGGNLLRGAIVGDGDIDMREALKEIKQFGYDGYISIEFEGMEDCIAGSKMGLENAAYLWENI